MNRKVAFSLVLLGALAMGCSSQALPTAPSIVVLSTATPRNLGTLRFSLNGPADVLDVPRLIALDSLKEQGYAVEQIIFADQSLIPAALVRGDIEFGSADTNVAWLATAKGADLRTVVGRTNTTTYLISKLEVQTCRDLNGRPIAVGSSTTIANVMFERYMKENCPGTAPQMVVMNGSVNRVAALRVGELDAARLEIVDWLQLKRQVPGKFHVLIDLGKEFPLIQFSSFSVRQVWAQQNPEAVKDFVRALVAAHRRVIENPQLLRDAIVKYLSFNAVEAQEAADAYLALGIWDANGGLTAGKSQFMLDFLKNTGALPASLKAEDVTDVSYLNAVLNEIGRK